MPRDAKASDPASPCARTAFTCAIRLEDWRGRASAIVRGSGAGLNAGVVGSSGARRNNPSSTPRRLPWRHARDTSGSAGALNRFQGRTCGTCGASTPIHRRPCFRLGDFAIGSQCDDTSATTRAWSCASPHPIAWRSRHSAR